MNWNWSDAAQLIALGMVVVGNWCVWRAMKIQDRLKKEQGR